MDVCTAIVRILHWLTHARETQKQTSAESSWCNYVSEIYVDARLNLQVWMHRVVALVNFDAVDDVCDACCVPVNMVNTSACCVDCMP